MFCSFGQNENKRSKVRVIIVKLLVDNKQTIALNDIHTSLHLVRVHSALELLLQVAGCRCSSVYMMYALVTALIPKMTHYVPSETLKILLV